MSSRPRLTIAAGIVLISAAVLGVGLAFRFAVAAGPTDWTRDGLRGITVHAFAIGAGRRPMVLAATEDGVYQRGQGADWRRILNRRGDWTVDLLPDNRTILVGAVDGYVDISRDDGRHWWRHLVSVQGVYAVTARPGEPRTLLAGAGGGIFISHDGGSHWQRQLALRNSAGTAFAWLPGSDTVYAGTVAGGSHGATQVYRSSDGGMRWRVAGKPFASLAGIMSVALDSARTLYAGTMGNTIWRISPGGSIWKHVAAGIPAHQHVAGIVAVPHHPGHLYIGTLAAGAFTTNDGGAHWMSISSGLPEDDGSTIVLSVALDTRSHLLFAATPDGVYRHTTD